MLHILFSLVDVREMSSIVQFDPFDFLDLVKEWLHGHILRLIRCAIDQEGRDIDLVEQRHTGPVSERARDV